MAESTTNQQQQHGDLGPIIWNQQQKQQEDLGSIIWNQQKQQQEELGSIILNHQQKQQQGDLGSIIWKQQASLDLIEAVKSGNEVKVLEVLAEARSVDVNYHEEGLGFTPLHYAVLHSTNASSLSRLLLSDSRIDLNARDKHGRTPLHLGGGYDDDDGSAEGLKKILRSGRSVNWNVADQIGQTPLLAHARNSNLEAVKFLIGGGEGPGVPSVDMFATTIDGFTALHQVAVALKPKRRRRRVATREVEKRCEVVRLLLEELQRRDRERDRDGDPNHHNSLLIRFVNATDVLNRSALHYVAEEGCVEILEELLEKCSDCFLDLDAVDFHGFSPLHLAVRNGHKAVVQSLLQLRGSVDANKPATINASTPEGLQPLKVGHLEDLNRADLFSKTPMKLSSDHLTPLHFAAMAGHTEVVELLLQWEGINADAMDSEGLSPLFYAVKNRHSKVVKLLLQKGAEPLTELNYNNQMCIFENLLQLATEHDAKDIAILLLNALGSRTQSLATAAAAFSNTENSSSSTDNQSRLLMLAAMSNHFKIIKYIVKWQPEVDVNASSIELGAALLVVASLAAVVHGLAATPLHVAALQGHEEAVRELLMHPKLHVNARDKKRITPLFYAIDKNHVGVVKALCLDPRLRATEENAQGQTPLQVAAEANLNEIEMSLIDRTDVKDFVNRLYKDRQVFVDAANALLVGAALIASVTFAGWLQPPLGYVAYYEYSQPLPAPPDTYANYAAVKQYPNVKAFWVFNSLSFFFAIATVLTGADAAMPSLQTAFIGKVVHSVRRALIQTSILLAISVLCVLGAFTSAGFAVLPPLLKYDVSMIITVCLGGLVCLYTLTQLLWKLSTPIYVELQCRRRI